MATNENIQSAINEAVVGQLVGNKKWYESKTFWANIVAGLTMIGQIKYGFVIPAEYQMLLMSFINIGLRKITKDAIIW
jgi:hypothetical protein